MRERATSALSRRHLRIGTAGLAAATVIGAAIGVALSAAASPPAENPSYPAPSAVSTGVPPEAVDASYCEPSCVPSETATPTSSGFDWTGGRPWGIAALAALGVLVGIGAVTWARDHVHRHPPGAAVPSSR